MTITVEAGRTHHITRTLPGGLELQVEDHDRTRPFLLLHGGGGVVTVRAFGS